MLRLGSPTALTAQEFLALPEDGRRHELLDGVHYVSSSPAPPHQVAVAQILYELMKHFERHPGGIAIPGPSDVVLSPRDVVEPDVLVYVEGRVHHVGHRHLTEPPDLVVEVFSPSTRRFDALRKRELYDRAGIAEYWLVDPEARTVAVLRRSAGTLAPAATLRADAGDVLETPLLPGLALPVERLFKDLWPAR
jgi:Uma2 family endonuclease